jgi:hypothetical protein
LRFVFGGALFWTRRLSPFLRNLIKKVCGAEIAITPTAFIVAGHGEWRIDEAAREKEILSGSAVSPMSLNLTRCYG